MKKGFTLLLVVLSLNAIGQDWEGIPVPADAGTGYKWQLQESVSDNFNYYAEAESKGDTFNSKWKDSYVNGWTGGSNTTWRPDQSYVNGSMLILDANREPGTTDAVYAGSISARQTVVYPVFIETNAKLSTSVLASCFWMVSLDQTQEIDIIEAFGTDREGKEWYNTRQHLSHHVFIRNPFQDYQPTDHGSWYVNGTVWSEDFHRVAVHWIDSLHLEYYIDGELVRVVYDKAFADRKNGRWYYTTPNMVDGVLEKEGGYQTVTEYATSTDYSFQTLADACAVSEASVIDAYGYTAHGLTKPQYILVTTAQQSWTGMEATDEELEDKSKALYYLDWIRVYKPVLKTGFFSKKKPGLETSIYPQPCSDRIHITSSQSIRQVEIYDINGTLLKRKEMDGRSNVLSTEAFPQGLYIMRLLTAKGSIINEKFEKL